jgi:hypothetical protein
MIDNFGIQQVKTLMAASGEITNFVIEFTIKL